MKRIHIEGDPSSDEERNGLDDGLKGEKEGKDNANENAADAQNGD